MIFTPLHFCSALKKCDKYKNIFGTNILQNEWTLKMYYTNLMADQTKTVGFWPSFWWRFTKHTANIYIEILPTIYIQRELCTNEIRFRRDGMMMMTMSNKKKFMIKINTSTFVQFVKCNRLHASTKPMLNIYNTWK